MPDNPPTCCEEFPNAGQCWGNQVIVPANYPTSGVWYQAWDFGTNPPTLIWVNDEGEPFEPAPVVLRKKKPKPAPKRPGKKPPMK